MINTDSDKNDTLYFTDQPARESPEWVMDLDAYTPIGTFTIDKAFGLADDPGCQMKYTKVDDNYYWSGDTREGMHFNELVNVKDVPDLDTESSEHISDYDYAYQYVLNMGYNSECEEEKGFAFFFHCFRVNRTYTGGCVGVRKIL